MEDAALSYFTSISSLSKKILFECKDIKNKFCDRWQNLPADKQEELLDQHFIDKALTNKYAHKTTSEILPDCFPILKIASGEKIVVDFEHDENGWTWTDEHSGPFSWRTKSQQDLTLEDVQSGEEIPAAKKKNSSKISSFKGYMEMESFCDSKNEVEEMFRKFGLRKSFDKNNDTDKNDITPDNMGFEGDEAEYKVEPSVIVNNNVSPYQNEKSVLLVSENSTTKPKKAAKSSKKKAPSGRKRSSGLQEPPAVSLDLTNKEECKDLGNYNEVFLDSREPSLEDFLSRPLESLNDLNLSKETKTPLKKTGLDFLDNW